MRRQIVRIGRRIASKRMQPARIKYDLLMGLKGWECWKMIILMEEGIAG